MYRTSSGTFRASEILGQQHCPIIIQVPLDRPSLRSQALPSPSLHGDLRQDRHGDFFRRDGAEVEAGRGLDAVDG